MCRFGASSVLELLFDVRCVDGAAFRDRSFFGRLYSR